VVLGETKDVVVNAAQYFIDVINDLYMAEDLLPLFVKYSSVDSKPKLKTKLFEIYCDLVEKSENYFDSVSVVRGFISKVFSMIDPNNKQISAAGVRAIEFVKDKNPKATLQTIFEMDTAQQKLIRRLFRENSPALEDDMRAFL
jgi:hypothetical protein